MVSYASTRCAVLAVLAIVLAVTIPRRGLAQVETVPADIQAQFLSKLAGYDRNFAARAGATARVVILEARGSVKSQLSAAEMKTALGHLDRIGGLPHEETIVPYEGAEKLAAHCRSAQIAAVYVTPGFDDEIDHLRTALADVNVMTVAAVPDYVPAGMAIGFGLQSGKPKLLINLEQARRQHVDFPAEVLVLMKVYR